MLVVFTMPITDAGLVVAVVELLERNILRSSYVSVSVSILEGVAEVDTRVCDGINLGIEPVDDDVKVVEVPLVSP